MRVGDTQTSLENIMNAGHYLVVGLGKTGQSIARYLQRRDLSFSIFDTRKAPELEAECQREFPNVPIYLEAFPRERLHHISAIIASPGVPLETDCMIAAKALGIPVYGDIECLAREVHDKKIVAITGTNGKSTVTSLVGLMAQAHGLNTAVAGNIGTPVLDLLADETNYDVWVLELSSFQLDLTETLKPSTATILNISPDHLDRHHTMAAYIAAKQRVYQHASAIVYNRDDELTKPSLNTDSRITNFGLESASTGKWGMLKDKDDLFLAYGDTLIVAVSDLKIKGRHNWANALAACALAYHIGIPFTAMRNVLTTFSGLLHRSQWVRTLDSVDWIDDSKGTNVGATQSAIAGVGGAISGKVVLIAGGQGKGADFKFLRESVANHVRAIVLLGQDADKLDAALSDLVPVTRVTSLEDAVDTARTIAVPGDVVLLSPACASLDMFRDYNHRGEVFKDLVGKLC